jgi:glucose repression mediator protein
LYYRLLKINDKNGVVWSNIAHCYLLADDLQKAFSSYQQALLNLPDNRDQKLWYGIAILYDRFRSLDNAEQAFAFALDIDHKSERVFFKLIYHKTL